ncbi:MAG: nucleoid-associated protein [Flavobacteriales bacterium]|nr:nucleoid-associated protein [Flavobacteriales bacterium]
MSEESALGSIDHISVHRVGNKGNEEGMVLSGIPLVLDWELTEALQEYFRAPLKTNEYYKLYHDSGLELNEAFAFVSSIFEDPENLHEQSIKLAKHLFECSTHPNIKGGEFYTVFFHHCLLDGKLVDAVGLFKSENKDTFLKVNPAGDGFVVKTDQGVSINKLDKGAIIFNAEKDKGYIVAIVDKTNKATEAQYWVDDFLHVKPREDDFYQTRETLTMTKNFITKELPQHFDVSKPDQADFLNRSIAFFKEQDTFDMSEFEAEVIIQPDVINHFKQFKQEYQQEREMYIADAFDISSPAVKKQQGVFKSILKLDKNFSVYIHGDKTLIQKGKDDDGRKYYKLYYQEEH